MALRHEHFHIARERRRRRRRSGGESGRVADEADDEADDEAGVLERRLRREDGAAVEVM